VKDIATATSIPDIQLFHDVFNTSPIGIAVENLEGQPLFVNPAFCSFLGFSEEELRNKHCVDFSPREDAEKDWALFQQLRAGSIDQYQLEKRYFRQDGSLVWGRLSVSLFHSRPSELVLAMVEDITAKKTAEEAVRMSEERFRLAASAGKMFAYEWDAATDVIVRSADFTHVLGDDEPIETTGQRVLGKIHPDDRERVKAAVAALGPENPHLRISYRIMRRDGTFVWVERTSRAHFDEQGKMLRLVGMVADITDLKQAEEAVSAMTRKLVEAQEQERARIARELHDDINQRLALVAVELEQLQDDPSEVRSRVPELRKRMTEISNYVQALSHDLHSSKLEYLGVIAGIKSWCKEFAERQRIEIDCTHDVRSPLPQEIGLCLFRVLQEGLHNAAKHSGVKRMEVELSEKAGEIHLTISDLGKGFDVEAVKQGKGLGLTSMRERVRLVNGSIAIDSKPMRGTMIHVRVPLDTTSELTRAAG
jgi:PAS domain S-box-containing protein